MSTSEDTEFDQWIASMVADHGEFTVLTVLTDIGERSVTPLCSTYFHVIGSDVSWDEMTTLLTASGHPWKGVAFFPTKARNGGPVDNPTARARLRELEETIAANRMTLNDGHYFDSLGRRIKIEPED